MRCDLADRPLSTTLDAPTSPADERRSGRGRSRTASHGAHPAVGVLFRRNLVNARAPRRKHEGPRDRVERSDSSSISTPGFCPTVIVALRSEGAIRQVLAALASAAPSMARSSGCSTSVGLMTATVMVLRSELHAATMSRGNVSLPALTRGSSPPGGYFGNGCGDIPTTSTGKVPKCSRESVKRRPAGLRTASWRLLLTSDVPKVNAAI